LNKPDKLVGMGLIIMSTTLLLKNCSIQLPEFIAGLGLGCGIAFELIGAYSMKQDISKSKN
jgi:hypothetical protein